MSLARGLTNLGFQPNRDFIVIADENGERIQAWLSQAPEPSLAAIAVAEADTGPLRESEKRAIDADAGACRLNYISGGAGQELVYQRKAEEARTLLAVLEANPQFVPDESAFPMLAAGLGLDGATLASCAALVAAKDAAWTAVAAAIDATRRNARASIDAAPDEAAIRAIRPAIAWPIPG